jgi:glycine cleavage system H protein
LEDRDVDVPESLRYTKDHEWLRTEGDEAVVGITAYAADELGDIVFVELPEIGRTLAKDETLGVIESVKTASDLFAPVAGEVIAVNEALTDAPELVNSEPYAGGWMVRLKPADAAAAEALMDAAAYRESIAG